MSAARPGLIIQALGNPQTLPDWTLQQWETLVREARAANLLGRLAALLEDRQLVQAVPGAPRAHLEAARVVSQAQEQAVRREVAYVRKALAGSGVPIVLLKGAAYLLAGLPAARGRLFSDIDILVPEAALARIEGALMLHGWATTHHNAYDQRYYRRWAHELPPMRHVSRQTVLDVHHAILPKTGRLKPDSAKLLAASRPLAGQEILHALAPADLVLHSASHLFLNDDLGSGLRDLVDLDSLLRHFGRDPAFWEPLVNRARELDLARPIFYALRYSSRLLGTPIPASALRASERARPPVLLTALMDALFLRALQPHPVNAADGLTSLARRSLYLRGHWLRMPPLLLAFHLTVKALRRPENPAD